MYIASLWVALRFFFFYLLYNLNNNYAEWGRSGEKRSREEAIKVLILWRDGHKKGYETHFGSYHLNWPARLMETVKH